MADINIEVYQAEHIRLNREKLVLERTLARLVERNGELERLVKDYRAFAQNMHGLTIVHSERDRLDKRAAALLPD